MQLPQILLYFLKKMYLFRCYGFLIPLESKDPISQSTRDYTENAVVLHFKKQLKRCKMEDMGSIYR